MSANSPGMGLALRVPCELGNFDELQLAIAAAAREAAAEIEANRAERTARLREILSGSPGLERDAAVQELVNEIFGGMLNVLGRAAQICEIRKH